MSVVITVDAPANKVLEVLSDESFIAYATQRADMTLTSVDVDRQDSGAVTSVTRRSAKSDVIPANFRSFVGSTLELRQTEAWAEATPAGAASRFGTFDLEIVGAPVRISGTIKLDEASGISTIVYDGEITASIPIFGATIEKAVGGTIQEVLGSQERLIDEWLTARS